MRHANLEIMFSILMEMFGPSLLWSMLSVATVITAAFIFVVIRDHKLESRDLVRAEIWAPVGGIMAILFLQFMTESGFSDLGGPIDIIVLILTGCTGALGLTILVYVFQALFLRRAHRS
jgi:hypothetical protein